MQYISKEEAIVTLEKTYLRLSVETNEYSNDDDESNVGRVLRQLSAEGTLLDKNEEVKVVLNAGVATEVMPAVEGMPEDEAKTLLEKKGFGYDVKKIFSNFPKGDVVSQSLQAYNVYKKGTVVTLEISNGPDPDEEIGIKNVEVPKLVGRTYDEVKQLAIELGLTIKLKESRYSTEPTDTIIEQSIEPGTTIENIQMIEVVRSLGTEKVKIDFYEGMMLEEVQALLNGKLKIKVTYEKNDSYKIGQIISQSLQKDEMVELNTIIILTVSEGKNTFEVKNVVGMTESEGRKKLEAQGLVVTVQYANSSEPHGQIISQTPVKGSSVSKSDTVTLVVSSGKASYNVVDVVGQTETNAISKLNGQSFVVKREYVYSNNVDKGKVISQNPSVGTSLIEGGTVVIYISKGKEYISVQCYNNDGGSNYIEISVAVGEKYGNITQPTREGYTFKGWYTAKSDGSIVTKDNIVSKNTTKLYAHWTANTYTIKFVGNGSTSGNTTSLICMYDESANLTSNSYKKDYNNFNGWNTKADGTGTAYKDGANIKNLASSGTVVLYAQWKLKPLSDFVSESSVPSGADIVNTIWRYTRTQTMESTKSSVSGWSLTGSYWNQTGTGSVLYSTEFPSGFDTSHYLYTGMAKAPYESYDNGSAKREVKNDWTGYIYWHWTHTPDYVSGGTYAHNRVIEEYRTTSFTTFYALASSTNFTYSRGIYNLSSLKLGLDAWSYWFYRFNYYTSTYTDYEKVYKYQKVTTNDSETSVTAGGEISNVRKLVQYREK